MDTIRETLIVDGKETNYKEVIDQVKLWMDHCMVINRDRITLVKDIPLPIDVSTPSIDEMKMFNYTGLEYLIATCISLGEKICVDKLLEARLDL